MGKDRKTDADFLETVLRATVARERWVIHLSLVAASIQNIFLSLAARARLSSEIADMTGTFPATAMKLFFGSEVGGRDLELTAQPEANCLSRPLPNLPIPPVHPTGQAKEKAHD